MKILPEAVLAQHIAVLGKTGSGKTCTVKLIAEQVVPAGARVCVLDPIKSDWWGLTSSADGKRPGLPFHILGGPRGHVPLHAKAGAAIGEIVGSGALPLSILDMVDFEMGGLQQFFVHFAPALLRKMRGILYLVVEEAHEFAPKERGGFGAENMAIHFAKKLATAGRSRGIRLVVATQRTQALHNALLGSCETLIAHRMTAPADQEPVVKWLKAKLPPEKAKEVAASLQSLKTGEAWVCSGELGLFERKQFPMISTYDNSATPTADLGQVEVATAAVDRERLRAIVGQAVEEAEANDPAKLRAQIAMFKARLTAAPTAPPRQIRVEIPVSILRPEDSASLAEASARLLEAQRSMQGAERLLARVDQGLRDAQAKPTSVAVTEPVRVAPVAPSSPRPPSGGTEVSAPQRRILDVVAMLQARGLEPSRDRVARWLGIHPKGGSYGINLAFLRANGYLDGFSLTPAGRFLATAMKTGLDGALEILTQPQRAILLTLHGNPSSTLTRDSLAEALGIHPKGGSYGINLARLRTMGLVPDRGGIRLTEEALR